MKIRKTFDTGWKWCKSIPWYGIGLGLLFTLGFQTLMYNIGDPWISHDGFFYGYDPQIPEIDSRIPLMPYVFIQFYQMWYVLFPIGAVIASARITKGRNKQEWINLMISWIIAIFIGGMIFLLCPTYIDRQHVAGVPGGDIFEYCKGKVGWSWDLQRLYVWENQARLYGSMPSFHCLNIIFCYLSVARRKDKHIAHRVGWLFIAIMICMSTVFVKQHYIIDVFAAIILAVVPFVVVKSFNPAKAILKKWPNFLIIEKINWSHEKIYNPFNK